MSDTSGQRLLLVVDDIAENRDLFRRYFGSRGFQMAQADCGATALGLIKRQRFDAVLLDIVMPEIDGIEVLKRIREVNPKTELPVIMVARKARVWISHWRLILGPTTS